MNFYFTIKCSERQSSSLAGRKLQLIFFISRISLSFHQPSIILVHLVAICENLHYITGIRFDIFGASSSNMRANFIFQIPGRLWSNTNLLMQFFPAVLGPSTAQTSTKLQKHYFMLIIVLVKTKPDLFFVTCVDSSYSSNTSV